MFGGMPYLPLVQLRAVVSITLIHKKRQVAVTPGKVLAALRSGNGSVDTSRPSPSFLPFFLVITVLLCAF